MASTTRSTVVGVFRDPSDAQRAISALKDAGFRPEDIGILMRDRDQARDMAQETGTHAGEGAGIGAISGGILGGLAGWLVGVGALAIPGIGPIIAAGAFATALGGAAIGAGVGAIAGALVGLGIPEEEAKYYENEVRGGGTLVTVKADGRYTEARDILRNFGAYDIQDRDLAGTTGVAATAGMAGTHRPAADTPVRSENRRVETFDQPVRSAATPSSTGDTVRLREEELRASKQRAQTGEVVVGKDVVEEKRTIDVPVRREEVYVERRPVEGHQAAPGEIRESESEIRVPVTEEQVRVEKIPVVKEELRVGKRAVEDTRTVSDTVRKEVPDIDRKGDVNVAGAAGARTGDWNQVMPQYRASWQSRYGSRGGRWEDYEPGYRYAYQMANDPRYRDRSWAQAEPELRAGYTEWAARNGYRAEPNAWERFKDGVQDMWDNVRGRPGANNQREEYSDRPLT